MKAINSAALLLAALVLTSCSSAPKKEAPNPEMDAMRTQLGEIRNQMTSLASRLDSMETKVSTVNEKLDSQRTSFENAMSVQKPRPVTMPHHPSDDAGLEVSQPQAKSDPEAGYETTEAIQNFRKAMILFEAQKWADSVLAFSNFVDKFPDHPLAGSAQYYVAESYFQEREYKLALQEYERVITTYDRSAHVPDTLGRMAEIEDRMKLKDAAARHRHLLTSLFPQSPAAGSIRLTSASTKAETPQADEIPTQAASERDSAPKDMPKLDETPPTAPAAAPPATAPATKPQTNAATESTQPTKKAE